MNMLKYFKGRLGKSLFIAALLAAILGQGSASAQMGYDYAYIPYSIDLVYPTNLTATASNFVADLYGFVGVARIDAEIYLPPNAATNIPTLSWASSPDRTNWTLISYGIGTSNSFSITNGYWSYASGTNFTVSTVIATNTVILPGTTNVPNAAQTGAATAYFTGAPLTNTGAYAVFSVSAQTGGARYSFYFKPADMTGRYLRATYTDAGATTTNVLAEQVLGFRSMGQYP
jgi:hypothetical protein